MIIQPDLLQAALENGEIELKGQFILGSNYTFLVTVKHAGQEFPAVYKPQKGEQALWDFPENTLAGREVCAYVVSQALGFGFVPFTIFRDGPLGPGSLQEFINHDINYHYFNFKPADLDRLRPVVLFDQIINNADRKGSHILVQKRTRRLYLIDHGVCFHAENKLRTVVWDFAGEVIPVELMSALSTFHTKLEEAGDLLVSLGLYLNQQETTALRLRAEAILTSDTFPSPPEDRHAFPFPPI